MVFSGISPRYTLYILLMIAGLFQSIKLKEENTIEHQHVMILTFDDFLKYSILHNIHIIHKIYTGLLSLTSNHFSRIHIMYNHVRM